MKKQRVILGESPRLLSYSELQELKNMSKTEAETVFHFNIVLGPTPTEGNGKLARYHLFSYARMLRHEEYDRALHIMPEQWRNFFGSACFTSADVQMVGTQKGEQNTPGVLIVHLNGKIYYGWAVE